MNNDLLRRLLIDEEGCKLEAYKDSEKKLWHIGIGHNLEIEQTDDELAVLGEFDHDDPSGFTITEKQAHDLFDIDVQDAIEDIYPFFTDEQLDSLNETRYAVILSMAFQMGGAAIRKFKNFKKAVLESDWEAASQEMVTGSKGGASRWLIQTRDRCLRAADAMKLGYFEIYQDNVEQRSNQVDTPLAGGTDQELIAEMARRFGLEIRFITANPENSHNN